MEGMMTVQSVAVKLLRPTQIAVGMKLVKHKRKGLRERERKPQELIDFILANPIRVVAGPEAQLYVIDHHHLAHALLDEGFKTAPVVVVGDLSTLALPEFWREMEGKAWVHPFDGKGRKKPLDRIPYDVADMQDDPYRSLAGFVRLEGGFSKTDTPYMEFVWADYFRSKIVPKILKDDFEAALRMARKLAASADAKLLPGFVGQLPKPSTAKKLKSKAAATAA
jgi:hypothetical protein